MPKNADACPLDGVPPPRRLPPCLVGAIPVQRLVLDRGDCRPAGNRPRIRVAADVARLLRRHLGDLPQEVIVAVLLNSAHSVLGLAEVAMGGMESVRADMRVLLGAAVAAGAPRMIVVHNHPSGGAKPSRSDDEFTWRVHAAACALGVVLVDHVVLGEEEAFYSYAERGRLPGLWRPVS